jgi:hypothetical protein
MAVPTTTAGNISFFGNNGSPPFDGVWSIANPGNSNPSNESLRDLLAYDYFHGPNAGNTVNFNGWGENTGTSGTAGDSRIYGISVNSSNINYKMSDPAGLEYYYDNTTYYSVFNVNNTLGPGPPPPPPADNNVNANIYFGNPQGLFSYMAGGGLCMFGISQAFPLSNAGASPLINNGFWYLSVSATPNLQAGVVMDFTINGNAIFTGTGLAPGANFTDNWTNYGTIRTMASSGGYIGFNCQLTIR